MKMSIFRVLIQLNRFKKDTLLDKKRIAELQEMRFRKLLKYAYRKSPFYKEYYGKQGIKDKHLEDIKISDLPVITKNLIMKNFDRFLCVPRLKREALEKFIHDPANLNKKYNGTYTVLHTSGSSGSMGIFVYGPADWAIVRAMVLHRVSKSRKNPFKPNRIAYIGALDGHFGGISLIKGAPRLLYKLLLLPINLPVSGYAQQLNQFRPEYISGYSSGINLLALAQLKGELNIAPRKITGSGDPMSAGIRKNIKEAFRVEPGDFYAATESLCLGYKENPAADMELFNDWHIFEIPCNQRRNQQRGNLLLTNLYNFTQPLIRYKMNDILTPSPQEPEANPQFRRISSIEGRAELMVKIRKKDGRQVIISPHILGEFFVPGLEKFQYFITQSTSGKVKSMLMKAKIRGRPEERIPAIKNKMAVILKKHGLKDELNFTVEVVEDINNDPQSGKFKLVNFIEK